ncbi:MAG: hypothetical protein A2750_03630 [Candidatus Yanofskybacteria bacterium RIFCSPHIGHO2_01_FULL_45_42]|uniref:PDZ domain-containing protein n=3 Tax=Candidatus Yanofskyibacteriota TaxID=1752733 RepID=A0A1F8H338_9BACT|nr:MAG: hypothetical protein A2750_03630 [Candidatus Yanofskybacteria bacterium RIFCSPHIGHO2_01_FULL_45_42]OGN16875.1 MAG: hypothetical protein A3C81_03180 [Candidatus Yanofskybacteria bacterium RIFCSPHIGHO2_02_FULL_46_19]OGN27562.1 MAG: hypothetical protein A3B17_00830 [Candidatus Yanofskybacteria bacterium RIFCSPLOWO2_01_FULL_45_72]OGN32027.1 MAG: hypothetical protein A3J01_03040 [Candidatus Yanofskybacteria bacterium RIFCSPLOWO2_02_FULL_45_18]
MSFLNRKLFVLVVVVALVAGFTGGFYFAQYRDMTPMAAVKKIINRDLGKPQNVDFNLFWQVWDSLHQKYVDKSKLDDEKLVNGAIKGMADAIGDPYTVFLEPTISKKFQEEISGSFGGVGIEIGKRNGTLTVIAPIKNSPAFKAGIMAGDKILKIDGKPAADLAIEEAVNLIRGRRGTKVTLTVSHNNATRDVEIVRDTIKIPGVEWKMLDNHIAYIQIFTFNQNVDSEFEKSTKEILQSKADRIILDLRNNPGGLLDSAINIAGWFLDKGKIVVSEDYGNGINDKFTASGSGALKSYPLVVLINNGSASASEILAGALHDNRGVKLIGEKSFGKGSVQELVGYDNGSSLKITIAKWLTPNGISISEKGIEADIVIAVPEKQMEDGTFELGIRDKDAQLDKALEIIR